MNGVGEANENGLTVLMQECPQCKRNYVLWPLPKDLRQAGLIDCINVECVCGWLLQHFLSDWVRS